MVTRDDLRTCKKSETFRRAEATDSARNRYRVARIPHSPRPGDPPPGPSWFFQPPGEKPGHRWSRGDDAPGDINDRDEHQDQDEQGEVGW